MGEPHRCPCHPEVGGGAGGSGCPGRGVAPPKGCRGFRRGQGLVLSLRGLLLGKLGGGRYDHLGFLPP